MTYFSLSLTVVTVHLYTQSESESESIIAMMRCIIFRIPVHVPDMYKDVCYKRMTDGIG
jgi:hypothetical protein